MTVLAHIDRMTGAVLRAIPTLCFAGLFGLLFVNVVARTLRITGFAWFDEVVQGLFAWMVFLGAAALWREKDHFQVDWLHHAAPAAGKRWLQLACAALSIAFLAAMTWYGGALALGARALTPILDLPTSLFYAAIPISGAVMLIYSLADAARLLTGADARET